MDADYLDKLYLYLLNMKPLDRVSISVLTEEPEKFIESTKYLMDCHPEIRESLEFENDYSGIRKLSPISR